MEWLVDRKDISGTTAATASWVSNFRLVTVAEKILVVGVDVCSMRSNLFSGLKVDTRVDQVPTFLGGGGAKLCVAWRCGR